MSPTDENLWRALQVGDRVQIVHYPSEFSKHDYTLHAETRDAYRHLIETNTTLVVSKLDDDGYPWIDFEIIGSDGRVEYHSLMLNHDGIRRVAETIE
jgi:hypothetical protein